MGDINSSAAMDAEGNVMMTNWLLLLTLLSFLVGGAIIGDLIPSYIVRIIVTQLFVALPLLVWSFCVEKQTGRQFCEEMRIRKIRFSDALLIAVLMLFLSPVLTFVNLVSQLLTKYVAAGNIIGSLDKYPFIVSFLVIAVLPAVTEELVYRGMLYGGYRKRSALMGALMSGLVFGMMHGNINQFAYAFVMGFVFALVTEVTGSIVSSMLMHLIVNGSSVLIVYAARWLGNSSSGFSEMLEQAEQETEQLTWSSIGPFACMALIGGLVAYRLFWVLAARCRREEELRAEIAAKGKGRALRDLITTPLVVVLAVLFALIVLVEVESRKQAAKEAKANEKETVACVESVYLEEEKCLIL